MPVATVAALNGPLGIEYYDTDTMEKLSLLGLIILLSILNFHVRSPSFVAHHVNNARFSMLIYHFWLLQ